MLGRLVILGWSVKYCKVQRIMLCVKGWLDVSVLGGWRAVLGGAVSGQGRSHRVGEHFSVLEQQLIIYLHCYGLGETRAQHKKDRSVNKGL